MLLLVTSVLLVQTHSVQTYLGHKAAEYLSDELDTKVEIGRVEIEFFKKVVLSDVYIEDQHKDTLLYSKQLRLNVSKFSIEDERIDISSISLSGTRAHLVKHEGDKKWNYRFIIEMLGKKDTTNRDTTAGWMVNFNELTLEDVEVIYRNANYSQAKREWINWNDLVVRNINGKVSGIVIEKDTVYATVQALAAKEKSGFVLDKLSGQMRIDPHRWSFTDLRIKTPQSEVATYLEFKYKDYEDFDDFIGLVRMRADLKPSQLFVGDLGYFAPELMHNKQKIVVAGNVTGKVADLKGKNLEIMFGENSGFKGDVSFTGLPDIEQTVIGLDVELLTINKKDLEKIQVPPFKENKYLELPENLGMLGQMTFKGDFDGFINDFFAHGRFTTAMGNVSSSIAMQQDEKGEAKYHGKIRSTEFNIGRFIDVAELGKVTIDAEVDGRGLHKDNIHAKLKGLVKKINYNGYDYQNAEVEGELAKNTFKGLLTVKDDNIDMVFNGTIDFSKKLPTLDFISTIEHADLRALNFVKDRPSVISTQVAINVTGNNIDNLVGRINFDNTIYRENKDVYRMSRFDLISSNESGQRSLRLNSDFADASVTGKFTILEMTSSLVNLLGNYIPSLKAKESRFSKRQGDHAQDFSFAVNFRKTAPVMQLLKQDVIIAPGTMITGKYNSTGKSISVQGNSSMLELYGTKVKGLEMNASTANGILQLNTKSARVAFSDSVYMESLDIHATAQRDSIQFGLSWNNTTPRVKYNGDINGAAVFFGRNKLKGSILPSTITIADTVWSVQGQNEISVDSSYIYIRDLMMANNSQSVKMNGAISKNSRDQLILGLSNFNLSNIHLLTRQTGLDITGLVSGNTSISGVYDKLKFSSSVDFRNLKINSEAFTQGTINTYWDKEKDAIQLNGSFSKGILDPNTGSPVNNFQFDGMYYPGKKDDNIDINLYLLAMRLDFFEEYAKEFSSDLKGQLSGVMKVKGSTKDPQLSGKLTVQAKKVRVNYLNTNYSFAAEVDVEPNSFGIENVTVFDQNGNSAVVRGKVYHDKFKNFQLDFDINAKKFMVLNTTEAHNKLYYGKAYASGIITIFGYLENMTIDAAVKTERGTQFNIPLSGTSEVSENNFMTFIKKEDGGTVTVNDAYKVNLDGMQMNFDLEVTPDAEVQLIFDSKIGDVIKGRGQGNIKMDINTSGNFEMYGDYNITSGDYLFTLQNVINKKFEIEHGSVIKWSGNPYDADINLVAVYKPRASLHPFFPTDSTGTYKKRYPVDCKLIMTNKLMTPEITFDIDLPTVDENTRTTVKSYINTEAEMNRQVFALLILKSFVTPPQWTSQGANEYAGAGAANSSELLSNQLSNWLSQLSKDIDIGVNYRPGDELNNEELEVALSKQIFNDRITIDGNVTVSDKNNQEQQNTSNIVGDFNVEYKLTDDGKVKVKAFNKANDNTLINDNSPYTQGVGVFYREEFNTLGDLYRRWANKFKKKKAEAKAAPPPQPPR